VLLSGGGPDGGDQLVVTSYRSELGGIARGLSVIGTNIRAKSFTLVWNNEASIKSCKRTCTQSVFHRTEGDHDLKVQYEWVKGHADDLNRYPTKHERLNIVADELCDVIRDTARAPFGARPKCGLWHSERCALFIRGVKVTSNWKKRLTQKLLDGDLQECLMEK
jgi:hypothetical protein